MELCADVDHLTVVPDSRGGSLALAGLLALTAGLGVWGIDWGMPGMDPRHGDEVSRETLRLLASGFSGFPKYPFVHYLVLAVAYSPYLAWLWITGGLEPGAGSLDEVFADPLSSMTVIVILSRLVTLGFAVATVALVHRLALRLTGSQVAAWCGAACLALTPEWILFSHMVNVDVPMIFWFTAGLWYALEFAESGRVKDAWKWGVLVAVGVSTKEQIAGAWVLVGCWILGSAWRARRLAKPAPASPPPLSREPRWITGTVGAIVVCALTYALLNKIPWDFSGYLERMRGWFGAGTDPAIWGGHPATLAGHGALWWETLGRWQRAAGWPIAVLTVGLAGFACWRGARGARLLGVCGISYYLFTIAMLRYAYTRFTLPWLVLLALLTALGVAQFRNVPAARRGLLAAMVFVVTFSVWRGALLNLAFDHDPRVEAEEWLAHSLPSGASVESYAYGYYLPRRHRVPQVTWVSPDREDMTIAGFQERRPSAAILAPAFWFQYQGPAKQFIHWLRENSEYEPRWFRNSSCGFLARDDQERILPSILILVDPEQGSSP